MVDPKEIEQRIILCEGQLEELLLKTLLVKSELQSLKEIRAKLVKVKWVQEINKCFKNVKNKPIPVSTAQIINMIESRTGVIADKTVKNKVSTVLSRMVNAGEICKGLYGKTVYYGYPELFEADKTTLKNKYTITLDDDDE